MVKIYKKYVFIHFCLEFHHVLQYIIHEQKLWVLTAGLFSLVVFFFSVSLFKKEKV